MTRPIGRLGAFLLGLALVIATVLLDIALGPHVELVTLYALGPVTTAWCGLRRDGELLAFTAAGIGVLLHLFDGTIPGEPGTLATTLLLRFLAYSFLVVLLAQLRVSTERLEVLSNRDELTGILNRRALVSRLSQEMERSRRYGSVLSLVYCDVDAFKSVNDRFGHAVGDEYLMRIAESMESSLRPSDVAARVGGDEFIVVLPETDRIGAEAFCARLSQQLRGLEAKYETGVSVGLAAFETLPDSVEEAITAADRVMYAEKSRHVTETASGGRVVEGTPPI